VRRDNFFKLAFSITFLVMLIIFSSNREKVILQPSASKGGERVVFRQVDVKRIKKLIKEGKLSDKEALFYDVISLH
jgi:hypothetical protein